MKASKGLYSGLSSICVVSSKITETLLLACSPETQGQSFQKQLMPVITSPAELQD